MNDCQEKALKEGCCKRRTSLGNVSSTEKTNTKEDLARVMTKSKSSMQTVTNGCVSQEVTNRVSNICPTSRSHRVSKIEVQSPQGDVQEGQRLMIIKWERYHEIGGLL